MALFSHIFHMGNYDASKKSSSRSVYRGWTQRGGTISKRKTVFRTYKQNKKRRMNDLRKCKRLSAVLLLTFTYAAHI